MRVLVCGGRDYDNREAVFAALKALLDRHGPLVVIQGGAAGADRLAREWCFRQKSGRMINEPADWKKHGKAAGPIRNALMLSEHKPDMVLAFPGGRGTASMTSLAEAAGIPIVRPATLPLAGCTNDLLGAGRG